MYVLDIFFLLIFLTSISGCLVFERWFSVCRYCHVASLPREAMLSGLSCTCCIVIRVPVLCFARSVEFALACMLYLLNVIVHLYLFLGRSKGFLREVSWFTYFVWRFTLLASDLTAWALLVVWSLLFENCSFAGSSVLDCEKDRFGVVVKLFYLC